MINGLGWKNRVFGVHISVNRFFFSIESSESVRRKTRFPYLKESWSNFAKMRKRHVPQSYTQTLERQAVKIIFFFFWEMRFFRIFVFNDEFCALS